MMFIASSNKGNVVSTNHLLLFPVSNERQVPVLCINMSSDLHRPSRHSGWRNATFRFTWQGCSYFFFFFCHLQDAEHQTTAPDFSLYFFLTDAFPVLKLCLASGCRPKVVLSSSKLQTHLWWISLHQKWTVMLKFTSAIGLSKSRHNFLVQLIFHVKKASYKPPSSPTLPSFWKDLMKL